MSREPYAHVLDGSEPVRLSRFDSSDDAGLKKEDGLAELDKLGEEFQELANLLAFAGQHALLIVLQGRDASGKDGTIRKILDFSNVQSAHVQPFKAPSEIERAHDFLWRIHQVVPPRGHVTVFNRSHYEDVIAARVHKLVPKERWTARYEHINAFERLLRDNDTILLKFYLHISRDEQYERLLEREEGPRTAWKLNPGDWREVALWNDATKAYEDALTKCASRRRPWYLVPADKKWFRNLAVLQRIVWTLRPFRKVWLDTLKEMGKRSLEEIEALRSGLRRRKKRG